MAAKAKHPSKSWSPEELLDLPPQEIQKRLEHTGDKLTAAVSLRRAARKREDWAGIGEQDDNIDLLLHRMSQLMIARDVGKTLAA
jgi:hypothetical protein